MKKNLVSILALFLVIIGLSVTLLSWSSTGAALDEQILASTIQIELQGKGRIEAGKKEFYTSRGLATLVQYGDHQFLMTHNHWSISTEELKSVVLRNAAGELLMELDGSTFLSLVRYHDAGTMLLAAPPQLPGVIPAPLGDGAVLTAGDDLMLATHDADQGNIVNISTAEVKLVETTGFPRQLRLQGQKTAVARGDSGGGVWYEGKLVGNLWAIIETWDNSPWSWFVDTDEPRPTGTVLVAAQPLAGAVEIPASDLAAEPAPGSGFERGLKGMFQE